MENNKNHQESSNNKNNNNNMDNSEHHEQKDNINHLTNEEYIKLFYNSNNAGVNKNFPLNVKHNSYNNKNAK
jgi:hypothetical protein